MKLLHKINVAAQKLSKEEQEDFIFGLLIKETIKDEAKPASVEKIINKWVKADKPF